MGRLMLFINFGNESLDGFCFTVETEEANQIFDLPLDPSGTYDFDIDFGDGVTHHISSYGDLSKAHTYAGEGTYLISITGVILGWDFSESTITSTTRRAIREVKQWGPVRLSNSGSCFAYCRDMTVIANDSIDVHDITDMSSMFAYCYDLDCPLDWDVSNVVTMEEMFRSATTFNGDISGWDTSNVENMEGMFCSAYRFNQDISGWNVSRVTNMESMFSYGNYSYSFNQDLDGWDTSRVINMRKMFESSDSFNGKIGMWDVSNVENMAYMFSAAYSFNQYIGDWDTGNVTTMSRMFQKAYEFNQDIGRWDVSNVGIMNYMFNKAGEFNQYLGDWDVSEVTNMKAMFDGAAEYNQDMGAWDTSSVVYMQYMFRNAVSFDQNIENWVVTNVTDMSYMFQGVTLSTSNYDKILISWASQNVKSNVTFSGGNSKYTPGGVAETARQALVDHGWNITDGGPA